MRENTCCLIGNGQIYLYTGLMIERAIARAAETLAQRGVTVFLNGGMGYFDAAGAQALNMLKKEKPWLGLESQLVLPYLNFRCGYEELFDSTVYPALERYSYKAAIIQRNRYMAEQSGYALAFVKDTCGGAYQTLEYARKQGTEMIML